MDDVEKQAMLDAHEATLNKCAAQDCEIRVNPVTPFCTRHWAMIPADVQREIMDPSTSPDSPENTSMRKAINAVVRTEASRRQRQ